VNASLCASSACASSNFGKPSLADPSSHAACLLHVDEQQELLQLSFELPHSLSQELHDLLHSPSELQLGFELPQHGFELQPESHLSQNEAPHPVSLQTGSHELLQLVWQADVQSQLLQVAETWQPPEGWQLGTQDLTVAAHAATLAAERSNRSSSDSTAVTGVQNWRTRRYRGRFSERNGDRRMMWVLRGKKFRTVQKLRRVTNEGDSNRRMQANPSRCTDQQLSRASG